MEYSTTFAAGSLLHEETLQVLKEVDGGTPLAEVEPDVLDVNSRSGRERRLREVERRLEHVDPGVWEDALRCTSAEQKVILYYACMKAYPLIADIHMNAVLPAWRSVTQELHRSDIQRFLDEQADSHPEIDRWSDATHDKVQQVVLKMLRDVELLKGDRLHPLQLRRSFWERFVREGDVWFLEAMFLNKEERSAIISRVSGS